MLKVMGFFGSPSLTIFTMSCFWAGDTRHATTAAQEHANSSSSSRYSSFPKMSVKEGPSTTKPRPPPKVKASSSPPPTPAKPPSLLAWEELGEEESDDGGGDRAAGVREEEEGWEEQAELEVERWRLALQCLACACLSLSVTGTATAVAVAPSACWGECSSVTSCRSGVKSLQDLPISTAVVSLSPVNTHTLMPAFLRCAMASGTPSCRRSSSPVHPSSTKSLSRLAAAASMALCRSRDSVAAFHCACHLRASATLSFRYPSTSVRRPSAAKTSSTSFSFLKPPQWESNPVACPPPPRSALVCSNPSVRSNITLSAPLV
mmetsp:Transcript_20101/g.41259  ORF Transcript_20101/g.41259 Transcript_20101/m.41259 type:complete len:319 (+) Transcript_20101:1758-2714(+)